MGYMGSGKSTLGKKIASAMDFKFVDMDKEIEKLAKLTISEIFNQMGEPYFRSIETQVLIQLSTSQKTVVALGGGTPCSEENIKLIKSSGSSVYIQIPPKGLLNRLENSKTLRPKIKGLKRNDLLEFIEKELKIREPYYNQANMIVDGLTINKTLFIASLKQLL